MCIRDRYISIEKLISDTKESYYEALQESSYNWHEEENDYEPFVKYVLGIIVAAYRDFTDRAALLTNKAMSKPDPVSYTHLETFISFRVTRCLV